MTTQPSIERRLASASVASFASFLVTILQSLLLVPLLLSAWQPEAYGQWIVVTTAFGLLTTMDLGLQNYVGNMLTMAGGDRTRIQERLGTGVRAACLTAAGLVVISAGLWFTKIIPVAPSTDSAAEVSVVAAIGVLVAYWIAFGSIGGIAVRLYPACGLLSRQIWLSLLQRLAMTAALVAAAWLGFGLVGATLAWTAAGSLVAGAILIDIRRRFSEFSPWWQDGSWREAVRLIGGSFGMIAVSLLDAMALTLLVILTDRWASAGGVALFAAMRTATNAVMQGSAVILTPVGPDLSRFAAARDSMRTSSLIAGSWLIATGPLAFAVTATLPITEVAFDLWTRRALPFSAGLFVSLIAAVLLRQWTSPLAMLLFCTNSIRAQFLVALGRCIASISVAAGLFGMLGIPAMGLGVLIGEAVAAVGVAVMTPLVFPRLCDRRCRRAGVLAFLQVALASGTLAGWWWLPSLGWQLWVTSLVAQTLVMVAQWNNLHPAARSRIAALVPAFFRRLFPEPPVALAVLPSSEHPGRPSHHRRQA